MNKRNQRQLEQGGFANAPMKSPNFRTVSGLTANELNTKYSGIKGQAKMFTGPTDDFRYDKTSMPSHEGPRSSGGRNNPRGAKGAR
jgi:hypothetical protein